LIIGSYNKGGLNMATNKFLGTTTLKFLGASTLKFIDPILTVAPSIQFQTFIGSPDDYAYFWRVTNLDPLTATVVSGFDTPTPTANSVSLASNQQSSNISSGSGQGSSGIVYARATAAGKNASNITSLFVSSFEGGE
jgi:hypothetical protein